MRVFASYHSLIKILVSTSLVISACGGSRIKSSSLVGFEQNLLDRDYVERLKVHCPDLVSEAMNYHKQAIAEDVYGQSIESKHYLELAHITWTTAERRLTLLGHRQQMTEVQERRDRAQKLLNIARTRQQELAQMQNRQAQIIQNRQTQQGAQNRAQNQEIVTQVQAELQRARELRTQAQEAQAPQFVPGSYKRAERALESATTMLKQNNFKGATEIARRAQVAFERAREDAQPFLKRQAAKRALEERMQQLIQDANQIIGARATTEMRGVVVTLTKMHRRFKLTSNGRETLRQVSSLLNEYHDLRIIVEGHTHSQGRRKRPQMLEKSQAMANEIKDILKQSVTKPLKITALGRGDYAPLVNKIKSSQNDRIDLVFFKPRIKE